MATTSTSGTTHVNGADIYWERSGSGPRLFFVNGSGATLADVALLLAPLAERFDVLAHDHRGMGRSTAPPGPTSMADYAGDIAGLLDAVGWDDCAVMGVSFGGMVAQEYAVTWPDRVVRLALMCTSPGGEGGASYPLDQLADLPVDERVAIGTTLLDTRFTPEFLAAHPDQQGFVDLFAAGQRQERTPEAADGARRQLEARSHHDVCARLHLITCPTLVASGRFDGIAPPANGAYIAEHVPQAEQRLYDGGHMFFVQDPTALPEALDFLAGG
jgi:pimeloyl-ACP methyl ester carboxylesterase